MPSYHVHFLPTLTQADALRDRVVVVIDVLRATTTISHALAAGAEVVVPCLEVEQARNLAQQFDQSVLGGERGGKRIEGFSLGNSPAEYTPERVRGKAIVFTTTNGTRAMQLCTPARRVLLGSFNNLSAVVQALTGEPQISLLCAGTDGHITSEDVLVAGAILDRLLSRFPEPVEPAPCEMNDEACIAIAAWRHLQQHGDEQIAACLLNSRGGRNLVELGMTDDVRTAARIDTIDIVAELVLATGEIRVASPS